MKKPVVSTKIGAEGLEVIDGLNILIADNPFDFLIKITALFENKALYEMINVGTITKLKSPPISKKMAVEKLFVKR